jgi:hypothetical protein
MIQSLDCSQIEQNGRGKITFLCKQVLGSYKFQHVVPDYMQIITKKLTLTALLPTHQPSLFHDNIKTVTMSTME